MSKKEPYYSDFSLKFSSNDFTGDLAKKIDLASIRQSIMSLLMTRHYDRCFHPEIGCNLETLLWKLSDRRWLISVENEIRTVLGNYEPRIRIDNVQITQNPWNPSSVELKLRYEVLQLGLFDVFDFTVTRTR